MSLPIPLPLGLAAFLMPEGPGMWHEFALGLDFAHPRATIDLLIAADAVTRRPDCDRATAALILAKASLAGFHRGQCPPGYDETAARAFVVRLTDALLTGAFARADLALPPSALRLVQAQLGPRGPLPMPPFAFGSHVAGARYGFAGWHPVVVPTERRHAA
jgi:hypothetical protein